MCASEIQREKVFEQGSEQAKGKWNETERIRWCYVYWCYEGKFPIRNSIVKQIYRSLIFINAIDQHFY